MMINKYYSVKNQLLFKNNGSDKKISSLLKFLQGYFSHLDDNFMCNHNCVKDDKIMDIFNKLSSTYSDSEALLNSGITCNYNKESYTVLKTKELRLLMVKTEYLEIFKDVYLSVNKDTNLNIINVISEYGMEIQGIILALEFVNVDGNRIEIKDYLISQLEVA